MSAWLVLMTASSQGRGADIADAKNSGVLERGTITLLDTVQYHVLLKMHSGVDDALKIRNFTTMADTARKTFEVLNNVKASIFFSSGLMILGDVILPLTKYRSWTHPRTSSP